MQLGEECVRHCLFTGDYNAFINDEKHSAARTSFYSDSYLNYSITILVSHPWGSLKTFLLLNNANNYDDN